MGSAYYHSVNKAIGAGEELFTKDYCIIAGSQVCGILFYLSVYALMQLSKRGVVPVLSDNLINYLASSWNLAKFVLFIDFVEPMHIL